MRIDKICKTCGFDSNGVCGMYTTCKEGEECDDWEASLEYYTEITKKAPWYIKKPYDQCKISYEKFLDLLQQDEQGVGVEINIYDAIEKVYELNSVELAGVLDAVSYTHLRAHETDRSRGLGDVYKRQVYGSVGICQHSKNDTKEKKTIFKQATYSGKLL